jgi:hypothetical protein
MHVMMQQPGTPVSIEREFGRDFVRSVGGTIALAGLASLLAAVLPRAGVNVPSWPYAILGVEFAIILRIGIVFLYRFKKVYRATMAYQPVPAEVLTDFAVSRAEFWIWTALLTAACTVSARNGFSLLILPVAIDWICGATKLELVRRARVKQLAIERYMTWKNRESLGNS